MARVGPIKDDLLAASDVYEARIASNAASHAIMHAIDAAMAIKKKKSWFPWCFNSNDLMQVSRDPGVVAARDAARVAMIPLDKAYSASKADARLT